MARSGVLEQCPNGSLGITYKDVYDCPVVLRGGDIIGSSLAGYLSKGGTAFNPNTVLTLRFSHKSGHIGHYLGWVFCSAGINAIQGSQTSQGIHLGMFVPCFFDANGQPLGDFTRTTFPSGSQIHYHSFEHGIIGKLETPRNIDELVGDEKFTLLL